MGRGLPIEGTGGGYGIKRGQIALRFRASGKQGYGVSPQMARRCFERMDAEGIAGSLTVLQSLSEIENAVTQGPVWRLSGHSV